MSIYIYIYIHIYKLYEICTCTYSYQNYICESDHFNCPFPFFCLIHLHIPYPCFCETFPNLCLQLSTGACNFFTSDHQFPGKECRIYTIPLPAANTICHPNGDSLLGVEGVVTMRCFRRDKSLYKKKNKRKWLLRWLFESTPFWKICASQIGLDHFPKVRGEI